MHPNEETLYYDAKLLCQYGMGDCNWITEVSEKDYSTRKDQVNEIKCYQIKNKMQKSLCAEYAHK